MWDPHSPYRTPDSFGNPFESAPLPAWLTEDVREAHWRGCGPHSAQEIQGFDGRDAFGSRYPRQPVRADSMPEVRRLFDGYDTGVRYADEWIGRILNALADLGVLDETAVIISADHGENLFEPGNTTFHGKWFRGGDEANHVPLVISGPGIAPRRVPELQQLMAKHHIPLFAVGVVGGEDFQVGTDIRISLDSLRQAWETAF